MNQKLLISGVVEEGNKRYFLVDFDEKSAKKFSDVIIKSREYRDNGSKRHMVLIPVELNKYEVFKEQVTGCIKKLKRDRFSKLSKVNYPLNGKLIAMNMRKSVEKNFLKNKEFHDFISKNVKSNRNVITYATEQEIKRKILSKKPVLFKKLRSMKQKLYGNDHQWEKFLEKHDVSIAAIMPTYNEINFESNIQQVHKVKEKGLLNELIITDGYSSEYEPNDVKHDLERKGVKVDFSLIKQNGAGKGEAIEAAVKYALLEGHDFVICVDSDVLPTIRRVYPDAPLNMNIEFFIRNFIYSIIKVLKDKGKSRTKKVFFKASYLRMPQLKRSLDLRYGLASYIVKDFLRNFLHSNKNLYPLSGEYAFNPGYFLENLNINRKLLSLMNISKNQYCGVNIPSGFCLENFWNGIIDIKNLQVYYVNMYLHHHGPVVKSSKRSIEDQRGEVMTGVYAGVSAALIKNKTMRDLFKKVPSEIIRSDRPLLEINYSINNKKLIVNRFKIC
tara:strand:+ start:3721 stop:5220 length:1500 start_codon:yes stop_codon:yes gene_type:complete